MNCILGTHSIFGSVLVKRNMNYLLFFCEFGPVLFSGLG